MASHHDFCGVSPYLRGMDLVGRSILGEMEPMIFVIAPNYTIARHVAEIDYKLSPNQWRRVRCSHDVRGYSSKDTTYIWAWPTGYYMQTGEGDAREVENYLIAIGIREHTK